MAVYLSEFCQISLYRLHFPLQLLVLFFNVHCTFVKPFHARVLLLQNFFLLYAFLQVFIHLLILLEQFCIVSLSFFSRTQHMVQRMFVCIKGFGKRGLLAFLQQQNLIVSQVYFAAKVLHDLGLKLDLVC